MPSVSVSTAHIRDNTVCSREALNSITETGEKVSYALKQGSRRDAPFIGFRDFLSAQSNMVRILQKFLQRIVELEKRSIGNPYLEHGSHTLQQ